MSRPLYRPPFMPGPIGEGLVPQSERVSPTGFRSIGGGGGGGAVPVNTVAPVLSGTVGIGEALTLMPGTWTGSPTLTYTLLRDGVAVGGLTGVSEATIDAYLASLLAADVGPSLIVNEIANGGPSAGTNALAFDDVAAAIAAGGRAVWDAAYVTLSGSDVATVTDRTGIGNDIAVGVGTAPLWIASDANFDNQPSVQHDGGTETLRKTSFSMGGAVDELGLFMVPKIDTAVTNDRWMDYGAVLILRQAAGPLAQGIVNGTGGATSTATTAMTAAHLVGTDAVLVSGNVRAIMNGAVEDTDANTRAAVADSLTMGVGAASDGGNTSAIRWAYSGATNAPLSAGYLANLHAYCQYRFGVA